MEQEQKKGVLALHPIAFYRGELKEKFGLPRQSGLVPELVGQVEMIAKYRRPEMFRGLSGFSHVWLLWGFSENHSWSPTVRPPRLGGNTRLGVFATRSPFRPNPLGLSLVPLKKIELEGRKGPLLWVAGADLKDGTPIYDIKPYVPYTDFHPEAKSGFAPGQDVILSVRCEESLLTKIPEAKRRALLGILAQDPRPHYQQDPQRIYGMQFDTYNVRFRIDGDTVLVVGIDD